MAYCIRAKSRPNARDYQTRAIYALSRRLGWPVSRFRTTPAYETKLYLAARARLFALRGEVRANRPTPNHRIPLEAQLELRRMERHVQDLRQRMNRLRSKQYLWTIQDEGMEILWQGIDTRTAYAQLAAEARRRWHAGWDGLTDAGARSRVIAFAADLNLRWASYQLPRHVATKVPGGSEGWRFACATTGRPLDIRCVLEACPDARPVEDGLLTVEALRRWMQAIGYTRERDMPDGFQVEDGAKRAAVPLRFLPLPG